jgi:hypothetical protein
MEIVWTRTKTQSQDIIVFVSNDIILEGWSFEQDTMKAKETIVQNTLQEWVHKNLIEEIKALLKFSTQL